MKRFYLSAIGLALTCAAILGAEEGKKSFKLLPQFTKTEAAVVLGWERNTFPFGHANCFPVAIKNEATYQLPNSVYYSLSEFMGFTWVDHVFDKIPEKTTFKRLQLSGGVYAKVGYSHRFLDALDVTPFVCVGYQIGFPQAESLKYHAQFAGCGAGIMLSYAWRKDFSTGVDFSIGHGLIGHCKTLNLSKTLKMDDFDCSYAAFAPITFCPNGDSRISYVLTPSYTGLNINEKGDFGIKFSTVFAY